MLVRVPNNRPDVWMMAGLPEVQEAARRLAESLRLRVDLVKYAPFEVLVIVYAANHATVDQVTVRQRITDALVNAMDEGPNPPASATHFYGPVGAYVGGNAIGSQVTGSVSTSTVSTTMTGIISEARRALDESTLDDEAKQETSIALDGLAIAKTAAKAIKWLGAVRDSAGFDAIATHAAGWWNRAVEAVNSLPSLPPVPPNT